MIWARAPCASLEGIVFAGEPARYNLLQGEGELEDAYGVVDLLSSELDFDPMLLWLLDLKVPGAALSARQRRRQRERLQRVG